VRLRIAHLYPDVMNLYGDNGNLVVLAKRLAWRGHAAHVLPIGIGSRTDLRRADLIVGGGGSDAAQRQVAGDLLQRVDQIREAMADGVPMLVVCGMFQLFGHTYVPSDGHAIPGIGIFDATSTAASPRITGPITLRTPIGEVSGFENHGGVTRLGRDQAPFGQVLSGVGNGAGQAVEGAPGQPRAGRPPAAHGDAAARSVGGARTAGRPHARAGTRALASGGARWDYARNSGLGWSGSLRSQFAVRFP
jgi:lipid II isoglutaminyl synthase (glutamine-hydrolysing)